MFSSAKIFIWDYKAGDMSAASQESIADLKEFFTSDTIFTYRPDVTVMTEFPRDLLGIPYPIFVVPGGYSSILVAHF